MTPSLDRAVEAVLVAMYPMEYDGHIRDRARPKIREALEGALPHISPGVDREALRKFRNEVGLCETMWGSDRSSWTRAARALDDLLTLIDAKQESSNG